jgi:hypothetical protein
MSLALAAPNFGAWWVRKGTAIGTRRRRLAALRSIHAMEEVCREAT